MTSKEIALKFGLSVSEIEGILASAAGPVEPEKPKPRVATIDVDAGLLAEVLKFPKGTAFLSGELGGKLSDARFWITHPDLKEMTGKEVPMAYPVHRRDAEGKLIFEGWGQEEDSAEVKALIAKLAEKHGCAGS